MTSEGQLSTAEESLAASGNAGDSHVFTPTDFTSVDGTVLGSTDAVIVRNIIHEDSVDIRRVGDPDSDGTFEIGVTFESRAGGGERHSDTWISTSVAGLEIVNTTASSTGVTLVAESVDPSKVFVEQANGLADASELTRTIGSHGQQEGIYELVAGSSADHNRRHDPDDDGTFEVNGTVESLSGGSITGDPWRHHTMVDQLGRTNPAMETALINTSGGVGDYMILGTIGVSL